MSRYSYCAAIRETSLPTEIVPACQTCDQMCCESSFDCSAICAMSSLPLFVLYTAAAVFCLWRTLALARAGRASTSSQMVIFYQLDAMFVLRSLRFGLIAFSGGTWQVAGRETADRLLYWTPLALLFSALITMNLTWTKTLSLFTDGGMFFRRYHAQLKVIRPLIVTLCIAGGAMYSNVPFIWYIVTSNILPLFVILPYVTWGTFKILREIETYREIFSAQNKSRLSLTDRLGRLAYINAVSVLCVIALTGTIVVLAILGLAENHDSGFCEFGQNVMRGLEIVVGLTLSWFLRGAKATSAGSTTATPGVAVRNKNVQFATPRPSMVSATATANLELAGQVANSTKLNNYVSADPTE